MKPLIKLIVIVSTIPLLIGMYFFDNIKGYLRFKQYCANEGGLHIYEPLEKNVGWWAKDKYDARVAALLKYVDFVRYFDEKDGVSYDLRYLGGSPQRDSSFEKVLSDESKRVLYKWQYINEVVPNELRLRKYGKKISNMNTNKNIVSYINFGYEKLDRDDTILDMPSEQYCIPVKIGKTDEWISVLNSAFKN